MLEFQQTQVFPPLLLSPQLAKKKKNQLKIQKRKKDLVLHPCSDLQDDHNEDRLAVFQWESIGHTFLWSFSCNSWSECFFRTPKETPLGSVCRRTESARALQGESSVRFGRQAKMTMAKQGDDCYFYYFSTCVKGDACPFRHCEAAMGSEVICSLWQENRCFRKVCKFRHMDDDKKRSEIPCYWENQPAGCQKPHCAFHHEKPRFIDGHYVPPSKVPIVRKEWKEEVGVAEPPPPAPASVANPANPQLRGVIKADTQENVPSPTHPPVVINTVDDEDEDEDDQVSEEGEEFKTGSGLTRIVSPRKVISTADLGQLSAQASSDSAADGEKESVRSPSPMLLFVSKEGVTEEPVKRRIAERLGKKRPLTGDQSGLKEEAPVESNVPIKRRLAERLGKKVNHPQVGEHSPKAQKSVRDRLGLPEKSSDSGSDLSANMKLDGEIRVKTLAEIRQEKMARSQDQTKGADTTSTAKAPVTVKRLGKVQANPHSKTFSEILHAKKVLEEQKAAEEPEATPPEKGSDVASAGTGSSELAEVRVKTLEEIRKEKAARIQSQNQSIQNEKAPCAEEGLPKRRIWSISKPVAEEAVKANERKSPETTDKTVEPIVAKQVAGAANGNSHSSVKNVRVKTFEEIMREKRLRKRQLEQDASPLQAEETGSIEAPKRAPVQLKERSLVTARQTESVGLQPSETDSQPASAGATRQPVSLKRKTNQHRTQPATVVKMEADSPSTSCGSVVPSMVAPSVPVVGPSPAPEQSQTEMKPKLVLNESYSHLAEPRVRPKVNVMPSVMKPATQVKVGQKQKVPDSHRSAIAEVKPLSSTAAAVEKQGSPSKRGKMPTNSGALHMDAQEANSTTDKALPKLESTISPAKVALSACPSTSVAQNAPTQAKVRRQSVAPARASGSAVDDFEQLMSEFTDDRLETEIELDPAKGEDDLLLELSEMIGS